MGLESALGEGYLTTKIDTLVNWQPFITLLPYHFTNLPVYHFTNLPLYQPTTLPSHHLQPPNYIMPIKVDNL